MAKKIKGKQIADSTVLQNNIYLGDLNYYANSGDTTSGATINYVNTAISALSGQTQPVLYNETFTGATSAETFHYTGLDITYEPAGGSDINGSINGVLYEVGYTATGQSSFYFMDSGETVIRAEGEVIAGDHLWFEPTATGFIIEADDVVGLTYSIVSGA